MITYGTLTRIVETERSGHIRTEGGIVGHFTENPEVGKRFNFFGKSLSSPDGTRIITTTPLQNVSPFKINKNILNFQFETESGSKYQLDINYDIKTTDTKPADTDIVEDENE